MIIYYAIIMPSKRREVPRDTDETQSTTERKPHMTTTTRHTNAALRAAIHAAERAGANLGGVVVAADTTIADVRDAIYDAIYDAIAATAD